MSSRTSEPDMLSTQNERPADRALLSETYVVQTMPPVLGKRDMTITAIMALFLLTNAVSGAAGGPISLVYLALGAIIFFAPCVVAAIQLGVLLPNAGSLYNWTTRALGPFMGFFIGLCFWLSGVLAVTTAGSAFVTTLQGLNPAWLNQPWQQGLTILVLTVVAALLGLQRMRTIQNVINVICILTLLAVLLVGLSAVVYLVTGHPSQTNFADPTGWSLTPSTFFLFALITLSFIGASGPLNMAGELRGRGTKKLVHIIRQHLLIGAPIVVLLYTIVTTSVLVVRGSNIGPFDGFAAVQQVLGKIPADVAVIGFLSYLIAAMLFYTYISARIVMAAGIDGFIPARFALLNRNRAPGTAIIFHGFACALVIVIVYIIAPALVKIGGNPINTNIAFFAVLAAACTLIWTIATTFFFIDLVFVYRQNPPLFRRLRQFPLWIIWGSVAVGGAACLLTVVAILVYPWIPLISNNQWGFIVGGLTLGILVLAAIASMLANSEATFEQMTTS
jgi:amino acid transporter